MRCCSRISKQPNNYKYLPFFPSSSFHPVGSLGQFISPLRSAVRYVVTEGTLNGKNCVVESIPHKYLLLLLWIKKKIHTDKERIKFYVKLSLVKWVANETAANNLNFIACRRFIVLSVVQFHTFFSPGWNSQMEKPKQKEISFEEIEEETTCVYYRN